MDAVYVVREGDRNEELRHSLRSLAEHMPHGRVWIAGYLPSWVSNVHHIAVSANGMTKYASSTANLRAACEHPDVSDVFWLMNDDMFLLHPVVGRPVWHRGRVADVTRDYEARYPHRRNGAYLRGMRETAALLARMGYPDPLSYELHVPMPVYRDTMLDAIRYGAGAGVRVLHKRTLYGNLAGLAGDAMDDVKVCRQHPDWSPDWPVLSTDDASFERAEVGRWIRARFPEPCRYERESA